MRLKAAKGSHYGRVTDAIRAVGAPRLQPPTPQRGWNAERRPASTFGTSGVVRKRLPNMGAQVCHQSFQIWHLRRGAEEAKGVSKHGGGEGDDKGVAVTAILGPLTY